MKATRKRRVYSYRVAVSKVEDDKDAGFPREIFVKTLSYDPSSEIATLLNVKPPAKPAKEKTK